MHGVSSSYDMVLTSVFEDGEWKAVKGEQFIYSDGTMTPLTPIRYTFDSNYLSHRIFVFGMVLMSLAMAVSLGSLFWVAMHRKERLVAAGQPEFLYALCIGSAICASTLVFVSFDEGMGYSVETLGSLCRIAPWLFVVGYVIIYCALAAKVCGIWVCAEPLTINCGEKGLTKTFLYLSRHMNSSGVSTSCSKTHFADEKYNCTKLFGLFQLYSAA